MRHRLHQFSLDNSLRGVLLLAIPAILEMSLHMLAWVVDVAMVGRLGADALSAVGLGGQVYFATAFFMGSIGIGITALVARRHGSEDHEGVARLSEQGLFLSLILGLLMTILLSLSAFRIYQISGLNPSVVQSGGIYLRILSLAGFFFIPTVVAGGIMRGTGDTRTPFVITAVTNVINIVGDYLLIFGNLGFPTLGVTGAAIALALGQGVGGILSWVVLFRLRRDLFIDARRILRPNLVLIRRILRLSIPAGLSNLLMDSARTLTVFFIASTGAITLASHQVASTAESLSFMPGYGFAIATSILTGQSLGRQQPDQAVRSARGAWILSGLVMGGMGLIFFLFPNLIVRLFTDDPTVIPLAAQCLRIAGLIQIPMATTEVFIGVLRGAGDTRTALKITAVGAWLIRVPLCYLAIFVWQLGLTAVWYIMLVEWSVRAVLLLRVFHRGHWKTLEV